MGRLGKDQRMRLRAVALSLAGAKRGMPSLPAELSGRILALPAAAPSLVPPVFSRSLPLAF